MVLEQFDIVLSLAILTIDFLWPRLLMLQAHVEGVGRPDLNQLTVVDLEAGAKWGVGGQDSLTMERLNAELLLLVTRSLKLISPVVLLIRRFPRDYFDSTLATRRL